MAKRNLARTAIEGGRHRQCRSHERSQTRAERHQTRIELHKLLDDRASADDLVLEERDGAGRSFADKLGPVYRWLEKQVGRPWTSVYSEIRGTFDFRTTAGRHIVDHLSDWVNVDRQKAAPFWRRFDFDIDERGMLVLGHWRRGRPRSPAPISRSAKQTRP
jgi:hypothetical protein